MTVYKNESKSTWCAKFNHKDWQGNIKQKKKEGFKTQKEAKAFEREFLNKAHASCDMTFGSLVELYKEDCQSQIKTNNIG